MKGKIHTYNLAIILPSQPDNKEKGTITIEQKLENMSIFKKKHKHKHKTRSHSRGQPVWQTQKLEVLEKKGRGANSHLCLCNYTQITLTDKTSFKKDVGMTIPTSEFSKLLVF